MIQLERSKLEDNYRSFAITTIVSWLFSDLTTKLEDEREQILRDNLWEKSPTIAISKLPYLTWYKGKTYLSYPNTKKLIHRLDLSEDFIPQFQECLNSIELIDNDKKQVASFVRRILNECMDYSDVPILLPKVLHPAMNFTLSHYFGNTTYYDPKFTKKLMAKNKDALDKIKEYIFLKRII